MNYYRQYYSVYRNEQFLIVQFLVPGTAYKNLIKSCTQIYYVGTCCMLLIKPNTIEKSHQTE